MKLKKNKQEVLIRCLTHYASGLLLPVLCIIIIGRGIDRGNVLQELADKRKFVDRRCQGGEADPVIRGPSRYMFG